MRVVLDTNVFVSGIFFGGAPRAVLDLIETNDIVPCFIPSTFEELQEVFARQEFESVRANLSFPIEDIFVALREHSLFFSEPLQMLSLVKEDPKDDKFLACALSADASFIISGDKHLLDLKRIKNIPILTPREYLKLRAI